MSGGAYKYCTAYSNDCLKEAIRFLEKKPASTNVLSEITHGVREVADPYIRSEASAFSGPIRRINGLRSRSIASSRKSINEASGEFVAFEFNSARTN